MKFKICLIFTFLLAQYSLANIEQEGLTIATFIAQLKRTNPFFDIEKTSTQIAQNEAEIAKSISDWRLNVDSNYRYQETDRVLSANYKRQNTINLNSELSKVDYESGHRLKLSHQAQKISQNTGLYSNTFSANLTKPLWRNQGGINDRLPIDIAKINAEKTQLNSKDAQYNFLLEQLYLLIDLAHLQEQLKIHQSRLKLANEELALTQEKYRASVVEKVDVLSREDNVLNIKQSIALTQQSLNALKSQLSTLLKLPPAVIVARVNLYQTQNIPPIIDAPYLLKNHYQLLALEQEKQVILRQLESNKNEERPDLSLSLGVSRLAESNNLGNSLAPQGNDLALGLVFSMPLNNLDNKANRKKLLLQLNQLRHQQQEKLINLLATTNTRLTQLNYAKAVLATNLEQLKIAKARAEEEARRYENGLVDASFVINAKNNEQNIALSYASNATNYQKYYLNYQALKQQDWLD